MPLEKRKTTKVEAPVLDPPPRRPSVRRGFSHGATSTVEALPVAARVFGGLARADFCGYLITF